MTQSSTNRVRGTATPVVPPAEGPTTTKTRRVRLPVLGLVPFVVYVVAFLAIPTLIAIGTGFFDGDGHLTAANLIALADPTIAQTFVNSVGLSLMTALIGATLGALACYALLGLPPTHPARMIVDAAASVLAQFGGVMLAFAFIATLGVQGLVTRLIMQTMHLDIFARGNWLYALPGLVLVYSYFQIPMMVITFMPAVAGLQGSWAEANLTLGGTRVGFWRHVGIPVLAPSFLASLLLLFANAFSSYATAAALIGQGSIIVPLQIRAALTSETVLGRENLAGALALGMIVVVALCMTGYSLLQSRVGRWQR